MMKKILALDPSVKSFSGHLADFRGLLVRVAICLCLGISLAMPLAPRIYAWLKIPFDRSGLDLVLRVTQVGGGFSVFMRVALWSGLLLSFPFLVVFLALYLLPVLHDRERQVAWQIGGASFLLFLLGSGMAYYWTVPVALRFMVRIEDWMDTPAIFWETASYISFVLRLLLAFGAAFQMPILVVLLGTSGLVSAGQLRAGRRYVITGLSVLAMLLTPPDPFTMVLMALPLVLLFEITIWVVFGIERGRRSEAARQPEE